MPLPSRPPVSGPPGGDKTELEMPAFPSQPPAAPAAPPVMRAAPVPQPAPNYQQPPQQQGNTEAFTMMEMQTPASQQMQPMKRVPQQPAPPADAGFTMLEMQAPAAPQSWQGQTGTGDSFTMMEMQAVQPGRPSQANSGRKQLPMPLRILLFIGIFVIVALALVGIFALAGVVQFG
jgi:hypothetical protein